MTPFGEPGESPPADLLAAYFDGEITDSAEHARVEAWLRDNPGAAEQLESGGRLRTLMRETRPGEPSGERWEAMFRRLREHQRAQTIKRRTPISALRSVPWLIAVAAACALIVVGLREWTMESRQQPLGPTVKILDDEVFPVATAAEVEILHVKGDDTETLVVGRLPVHEPLELASFDEITIMNVRPDARDQMVPQCRLGSSQRPMIWARLETE